MSFRIFGSEPSTPRGNSNNAAEPSWVNPDNDTNVTSGNSDVGDNSFSQSSVNSEGPTLGQRIMGTTTSGKVVRGLGAAAVLGGGAVLLSGGLGGAGEITPLVGAGELSTVPALEVTPFDSQQQGFLANPNPNSPLSGIPNGGIAGATAPITPPQVNLQEASIPNGQVSSDIEAGLAQLKLAQAQHQRIKATTDSIIEGNKKITSGLGIDVPKGNIDTNLLDNGGLGGGNDGITEEFDFVKRQRQANNGNPQQG